MPSQRGRLADGRVRLPEAKTALSDHSAGSTSRATPPMTAGGRLARHWEAMAAASATAGKPIQIDVQPSDAPAM